MIAVERMPSEGSTLVDLLRERADREPERIGFRFAPASGPPTESLTYARLDARARAIGALLANRGARGERVLVAHGFGPAFLCAFFGCLYAGAVAVPVVAPAGGARRRAAAHLERVARDCAARFVLCDLASDSRLEALRESAGLDSLVWLDASAIAPAHACEWRDPAASEDHAALLQYTSGSTEQPRGVLLSHANLLASLGATRRALGLCEDDHVVSWLPHYHDLGLIGAVLGALHAGCPATLLSPFAFMAHPLRWLQLLAELGGTCSGAPNFAYELCAARAGELESGSLDLRRWRIAFVAAEPIRADTLERFARAYASCGFSAQALCPGYGLAEATLTVTAAQPGRGATRLRVDARQLQEGWGTPALPGDAARVLIGCGRPLAGHDLRIVDPLARTSSPTGRIGEVWVRGDCVAKGYWNRPAATLDVFGAQLAADPAGRFLRTGDLGFLDAGGELFITGRCKDLLILRGVNHYPQDIEATAMAASERIRSDACAAFAVERGGEESLVVVCECEGSRQAPELLEVCAAVSEQIAHQHGVLPCAVVLIRRGTLLRGTSGKVRRSAMRDAFERSELVALAAWTRAADRAGALRAR